MNGEPTMGTTPEVIAGWWIDHHLGDVAGSELLAARRARALRPGTRPEYATVLLSPDEDAARRAIDALGRPAAHDAVRVDRGGATSLAIVLDASVVPLPATSHVRSAPDASSAPAPRSPAPDAVATATRTVPVTARLAVGALVVMVLGLVAFVAVRTATGPNQLRSAVPHGDPDVRWDPVTATATVAHDGESRRYVLGVPGDQLVLGDWDGDRVRTPALYRSTTGEVWAFDRWAAEGAPAGARPLGRLEAWRTVRVEHHDGRDVVVAVAPAA